ncbi:cytochrome P450 [Nocardioides pyridinolyticus]
MPTDLGLHLWRSGYRALPEERRAHAGADVFESSLLGNRAVVVRGREGARLFYDESAVERATAVPPPLRNLLFGSGAVHGLDGAEHRQRKQLFFEILDPERVDALAATIGRDLERRLEGWAGREVTVFDELVEVYGAAVLAWAGVELPATRATRVSHRLAAIVDGFGGAAAAYPRAWAARLRMNGWARRLVEETRSGAHVPPAGSALRVLADSDLAAAVAGVELLNVLRPTVAVAWPGTFLARELAAHPQWRPLLHDDPAGERRRAFGHETRRTCPFVPALAGRVTSPAEIGGTRVEPGDLLVLDVPGTDRDPAWWSEPESFLPERFLPDAMPDAFAFVPQGGGDPHTGHRCPGEPLTVRILAETARVLADTAYDTVGETAHDPERIPTLPHRGLVVRG